MPSLIPVWVWLVLSSLAFAVGEFFSKKFALSPGLLFAVLTVATYACASVLWLPAIYEKNTLAVTGVTWSILSLIATVGIGLLIFHEHLKPLQWVGIALGAAAVALLSI